MNRFGDIDASNKRLPPIYGYHAEKSVTIEKALEPIESEIEELPRFIKIAKKHCHFPSEHGLTQDQSAAIYIYTMEWGDTTLYRVLNKALRSENRQALKIWFPYLKLFDTALDKLPTVKEAVWRGIPIDIGKNFIKNQTVTWWSVNSCSSSPNVIKTFLGGTQNSTLFLIETMNGKKISGYTEYENEDEVILRMGSEFRVKGDPLAQLNGSYVVHLIAIDDNNDQPLASNNNSTCVNIPANTKWAQEGVTIAGGNGKGNGTKKLHCPHGLFVDDDQTVVIADWMNHRIIQWKKDDTTNGQVVAGGKGEGNGLNQLRYPIDVLIDKETDSLIICDENNRRVVRWSRRRGTTEGEILIDNIRCYGLAIDEQRYLYVSDRERHEVRRYQLGYRNGTIVAGGNGEGSDLNQLNSPRYLFVDQQQNVYISDCGNHRVMKWMKGAKEGIMVAGGQGKGSALTQLDRPNGLFVDTLGTLYVADQGNDRVMRWIQGAKRGTVIMGGNGQGEGTNQFYWPWGLSFDRHGNLYVTDYNNHRVQRFSIESGM
ncbi:unnamed protein product [Rotaria socialis]|uniref:NAD(P)(+)--arginine ADP-ribosyltransferase n=2 Tax=Rotaria socialis TaxID=392032 RepID=A0A820U5Y1_9BILA|nr:unnamed protein product [Rotaria socialis]CAF3325456.1 unnamed protein product [Rotaria socialis]CAF3644146.1 unnamed protein product [Rotaria socialis]CAF3697953.1 unnamed protein product [Rotaria socialis]CAF4133603.1 unnamed protein product [Rotaria socialis]